jgi:hypothetical protein
MVANPLFSRMTPVPCWSYGVWVLTAAVSGLLAATYVRRPLALSSSPARVGLVANVGSLLAVGCPVCNKLVVAAVGVNGALNLWAPIQPLIAATSLGLLGWALWRRMTALRSCPLGGHACSTSEAAAPSVDGAQPQSHRMSVHGIGGYGPTP